MIACVPSFGLKQRTLMSSPSSPAPSRAAIGFVEFVAMMAGSMALQAFAVDTMLPALPDIGQAFGVAEANRLQWIVTAFILGAGAGQLLFGPLSDWLGRRPILLGGLALYIFISICAAMASSLEWLIVLRVAQGVASASIYVVPRSIVRDRYDGPTMARVLSIIFMVFLVVPILAPSFGQALLLVMPWRGIFFSLGFAGTAFAIWIAIRLPETLHPEFKRVPRVRALLEAARFTLSDRASICYTLAVTVVFGSILSYVSTVPQIFTATFHRRELMAPVFGFCAGLMAIAAFLNSRIVERLGMRRVSHTALLAFLGFAVLHAGVALRGPESLPTFAILQGLTLAFVGLTISNFSAIAMEPMGAIAGSAASIQGVISMIGAALVASLIGQQWSGTVSFLPVGAVCCGLMALGLVLLAERGVMFRNQSTIPTDTIAAGLDIRAS
jgi:DHA1 family bicyclomycin/chloramphenicol resistance-like MFS transporter